ncbi:glycosyltransferase [Kribbella sp. NPDC055071]
MPLRLGIYSDTLLPRADGVAVSIEAAGTALRELGVQLDVVAPYNTKTSTTALPIRSVPGTNVWFRDYRLGAVWPPAGSRATAAPDYDVVHVHTLGTVGIAGLYAAWRRRIPVVMTWHTDVVAYQSHYAEIRFGMWLSAQTWRLGLGAPPGYRAGDGSSSVQRLLGGADLVIAPTAKVQNHLTELGCKARTVVLPSPTLPLPAASISVAEVRRTLRLGPRDPIVLSVGRLSAEKNDELLLRAFAHLLTTHPTACLVLVGQCRDRRRLTGLIDGLGIGANVRLPGVLPRAELAGYYAAASAVVIASVTETQSLVANEAEAAGCPLIVVDPWLARGHEETRILAEAEPADLAAVIGRSFRDTDSPRPPVRYRFDPRAHATELVSLYKQVVTTA